jgi:hypothetical protein
MSITSNNRRNKMKFYAYIPDKNGREPMGTANRFLFEVKTKTGALNKCKRLFNNNQNFRLFSYTEIYDDKTFNLIKENSNE